MQTTETFAETSPRRYPYFQNKPRHYSPPGPSTTNRETAMAEEQSKGAKKRTVDSLGWLTESSIMPRKQRAIEGVGASSILELKAQLYRSQEESKRNPKEHVNAADHNHVHHLEVQRAKKKIAAHDSFSAKNSGVDSRAAKDKLELKAVRDGSASYAALERKAELYDKLVRGELSDEEDQEKYCVDFFRKGLEQNKSHVPQEADAFTPQSQDIDKENDLLINSTKAAGLGRASATMDRSQHKHFVMEVHEEANHAREKVSELKMRRQEQAAARREKLKQAYLRKQLEKLKATKAEQT
ncbi:Cytochrome b561/ferric reductase transmembrane protein family [Striga hermonthica]|uniref:Cytochrome b561/ferric reductase transmembrane protein family n=1 Tax=Striga hermonthica TaxID=68872 RepID=A0A9N7N999_STRHE|nr:Cytochrome b561/ferric reductase transmembrane protein family [Striga hermonthica]